MQLDGRELLSEGLQTLNRALLHYLMKREEKWVLHVLKFYPSLVCNTDILWNVLIHCKNEQFLPLLPI